MKHKESYSVVHCNRVVEVKDKKATCTICHSKFDGDKWSKPAAKPSGKKTPIAHGLDIRDLWIFPALIVAAVIGYGMYMDGMLWLFALCVFALIVLRMMVGGRKGKRS